MNDSTVPSLRDFVLPAVFVALGVFMILFARRIEPSAIGGNHDPGPRAFPTIIGIALVIGGLGELGIAWRKRAKAMAVVEPSPEQGERRTVRVLLMIAALVAYIVLLPWMGFNLSTFLFGCGMLTFLGVRWWVGLLVSLAMVVLIQVLFARIFFVPLPRGEWGLPI